MASKRRTLTKSIACRIRRFIKTAYVRSGFFQKHPFWKKVRLKQKHVKTMIISKSIQL